MPARGAGVRSPERQAKSANRGLGTPYAVQQKACHEPSGQGLARRMLRSGWHGDCYGAAGGGTPKGREPQGREVAGTVPAA